MKEVWSVGTWNTFPFMQRAMSTNLPPSIFLGRLAIGSDLLVCMQAWAYCIQLCVTLLSTTAKSGWVGKLAFFGIRYHAGGTVRKQIRIKIWSATAHHFCFFFFFFKGRGVGVSMTLMLINPVTNGWVESLSSASCCNKMVMSWVNSSLQNTS